MGRAGAAETTAAILAVMPPLTAGALVFFTSAAVLVLEILAGRLLAPYVGVTLETYTGIIGVVLAGISLGTWLGGRLADRVDPRRTLGPMLLLGGALALCAVPAIRLFGSLSLGAGPVAIVGLAAVGFFAPAAVLSAVSPTVVKLQLGDLRETGTVVGRLSALGTAGAIVGTFATGFVLIAALPTTPIVVALGALLSAAGLALWAWLRPRGQRFPGGVLSLALAAGVATVLVGSPCQYESAYFCARVIADDAAGGRVLYLDTLRHSYVDLFDPTHLEFSYAQIVGDVLETFRPPGEAISALHIGGGGFTLPRYLAATRPGSDSLVLELDPTIVQIARSQLGLRTGPALRVRVGDARLALADQPAGRYDLVVGDAFGGLAVPWHLTTREFVGQIRRTLRPDGIYVVNLIDYPPLGFARAQAATLQAVFDHVALVAPPARVAGAEGGNVVLAASDAPLPLRAIQARNAGRGDDDVVVSGARLDAFVGDAPILTDDYAPVDQLLTPAT
ncbi:MAG TPA: fused MFS/spermidine synthase [Egibacteraceae bacterium]|nr:fused MFS/spermidine synthase [Egibacteraceae bacterium]